MLLNVIARSRKRQLYQGLHHLKEAMERRKEKLVPKASFNVQTLYAHINYVKDNKEQPEMNTFMLKQPSKDYRLFRNQILLSCHDASMSKHSTHDILTPIDKLLAVLDSVTLLNSLNPRISDALIDIYYERQVQPGYTKEQAVEEMEKTLQREIGTPVTERAFDMHKVAEDVYAALESVKTFVTDLDHGTVPQ